MSTWRWTLLLPGVVGLTGVLAATACGGDDDVSFDLTTLSAELREVNDSGYEGEVVIVSTSEAKSVVTAILGKEADQQGDFPASIQSGTCDGLAGQEAQELEPFRGGYLSQEIQVGLSTLTNNDHAFVVYQSDDRQVYLACADISE